MDLFRLKTLRDNKNTFSSPKRFDGYPCPFDMGAPTPTPPPPPPRAKSSLITYAPPWSLLSPSIPSTKSRTYSQNGIIHLLVTHLSFPLLLIHTSWVTCITAQWITFSLRSCNISFHINFQMYHSQWQVLFSKLQRNSLDVSGLETNFSAC